METRENLADVACKSPQLESVAFAFAFYVLTYLALCYTTSVVAVSSGFKDVCVKKTLLFR